MKYVGIDLGTTYSCISVMDDLANSTPKVIHVDGEDTTPSVVWFDDSGNPIVGDRAKKKIRVDPNATVYLAKRYIGTDREWEIYGQKYNPVDISAIILKRLFAAYQDQTNEECKVVVTCPANYDPGKREWVKEAARKAGLPEIQLLNEPTAAALSYCMDTGKDKGGIIIYDLGGGTLDITALYFDKDKGIYEVMASDGISELGGADWDKVVENEILKQLAESNGCTVDELCEDPKVYGLSAYESEGQKKDLSKGDVDVDIFIGGRDALFSYKQEQFEKDTEHLLSQSLDLFDSVLNIIETNKDLHPGIDFKVDAVVLVGGSSYMPQVRKGIENKYPDFAGKIWLHEPNYAISMGATYFAKMGGGPTPVDVKDVCPSTFGTDVDIGGGKVVCHNIMFKNDPIDIPPKPQTYSISPRQTKISNKVFVNHCRDKNTQATCPIEDCDELGNFDIELPHPAGPDGDSIEVKFCIRPDGTLYCEGTCMGVTKSVTITIDDLKKNLKHVEIKTKGLN